MGTCSQNCLGTKEIITKDDPALFDDQNLDVNFLFFK